MINDCPDFWTADMLKFLISGIVGVCAGRGVSFMQKVIIEEIQKLKRKFDTTNPLELIKDLKINL